MNKAEYLFFKKCLDQLKNDINWSFDNAIRQIENIKVEKINTKIK